MCRILFGILKIVCFTHRSTCGVSFLMQLNLVWRAICVTNAEKFIYGWIQVKPRKKSVHAAGPTA